jgi:S1-C subfamily serine protease
MKSGKWAVLFAVLVWALVGTIVPACFAGQKVAAPAAPDLSMLAQQARPAVGVLVTFDADGKPLSQGTAFFVRADGVGITCHHVLSGAASALVRMENGTSFPVKGKLAADPVRDLALFEVAAKDIPTVPLGDSSTLRPGQRVVGITAPEGLGNTIADGLVSAVRDLPSGPLVQVTVPLSPGSSGGPIFDLSGRVVAVAASVLTEGQALNFAIPINAAKPLLAQPRKVSPLAPAEQPADLEEWLRQRPPSSRGASAYDLWLQARNANLDGRYQEAVGALRAALALDPGFYPAHCCLGSNYYWLSRYQEALEALKQAIRLKPDHVLPHFYLGWTYHELGRYQEELEALKEAIRLEPEEPNGYFLLGDTYNKLGRRQEALEAYGEAIRLKPDHALAHYGLGLTYSKLGRCQEAVEAYREAIRLKPDDAEAHSGLGAAYLDLGDRSAALDEYRILQKLDPGLAAELFALIYP